MRCSQWCLVPLESRWEIIAECESLFGAASARVSSTNVSLAEVSSTLSLIRIGNAVRNELANWRYGTRLKRRRSRTMRVYGAGVVGLGAVFAGAAFLAADPAVAGWLALAFIPYAIAIRNVPNWQRLGVLRVGEKRAILRRWDLPRIYVDSQNPKDIGILVETDSESATLRAGRAVSFLAEILPRVNWDGGTEYEIGAATREVDAAESAVGPLPSARDQEVWERIAHGRVRDPTPLSRFGAIKRLALEMAVTEEMERRAFAKQASAASPVAEREADIAHIADNLFLPASITEELARLKRDRDRGTRQPNEEL